MQSVENPNMVIFFEAKVTFSSQGWWRTKYIVDNGCVIKVKNDTHVRQINQTELPWPEKFKIITPLDAINVVSGELPEKYLKVHGKEYYLNLRMKYDGH